MNKKLIIDGNTVYEIDLDCIECSDEEVEDQESSRPMDRQPK